MPKKKESFHKWKIDKKSKAKSIVKKDCIWVVFIKEVYQPDVGNIYTKFKEDFNGNRMDFSKAITLCKIKHGFKINILRFYYGEKEGVVQSS